MAGLLEWLSNQKDSAANDYADLMSNYPNAQKFSKGLINAISEHVPTQQDYKSPKKMLDFGMSVANMGMTVKNTNADLLKKYLSTGKLSPKEMAEYEANALKMETPQLQRYNLGNAMVNPERNAHMENYDNNYAHGSSSPDVENLIPSETGAMGPGIYATNYLPESNIYAGYAEKNTGATVYPLAVNTSKSFNPKKIGNIYDILNADNDRMLGQRLKAMDKDSIIQTQRPFRGVNNELFNNGKNSIPALPEREYYVTNQPENIRSRFAAFDPLRKNSSSLLASGLLGSLLLNNEMKNSENR
jgi:hypothetical protein